MILQNSPNAWSCLPTAFAIALEVPVQQVIADIGHDGSEIIFDGYPEPLCRRGFHTSELIDYCLVIHGLYVSLIPLAVRLWTSDNRMFFDIYSKEDSERRFECYLDYKRVVFLEPTHAVAYDGEKVYDPRGYERSMASLRVQNVMLISQ